MNAWHSLMRRFIRGSETQSSESVWLSWCVVFVLLIFFTWLLWDRGVWFGLHVADSTGITQLIVLVFYGATLWCGARAWWMMQRTRELHSLAEAPGSADLQGGVVGEFARARVAKDDDTTAMDVLAERLSGPHEAAWWWNGLLLKLGLLGTVVGFILMAFSVAQVDAFDVGQAQVLLQNMTRGMGVALLTTLVGLVGNMLLGWQLLSLDRAADAALARASMWRRSA